MIAAMIAWEVFACAFIFGVAYIQVRRIRRRTEEDLQRLRRELELARADRLDEPETEPEPAASHGVGA